MDPVPARHGKAGKKNPIKAINQINFMTIIRLERLLQVHTNIRKKTFYEFLLLGNGQEHLLRQIECQLKAILGVKAE